MRVNPVPPSIASAPSAEPARLADDMTATAPRRFSLRTKLAVFAALLVIVPGGIYGAISLSQSRSALAHIVVRQLVENARSGAERLASHLRAERERLEALAAQDVMREIRIADLDKRIASFLASAKKGCPACIDLLVVDASGRIVASSGPDWLGSTADALPGAGGAAPAASTYVQGPFRASGRDGSPLVLRFSVPIPDPDAPDAPAATLGRLIALMDWSRATEVVTRLRANLASVDLDADVLIVDEGLVIGGATRPDARWRTGTVVSLRPAVASTALGYVDDAAGLLVGHATVPQGGPPWTVVVAQPLADAYAPLRRSRALLASVLAATLLSAVALAVVAARRATRRLGELTAVAEAVGRGDRPLRHLPVGTRDEIGTLTEAFNRMAMDLRRAEQDVIEAAKFSFVGELAAGVAHEVRTPLGVLRSSAQLLACSRGLRDDDSQDLLRLLRDEVDRIDRVVSALLDLGRPRAMHAELTPLGQILARAATFVDAQARSKRITIRRGTLVPDPIIRCDPELIYQVALNLLVNAVHVLPEGGTMEVGLWQTGTADAGFEVRDDGPGMSEDVRARVFEPFFTHRPGGTGLGLTFCQRVIREHGGQITVDSAPGRGAAFRVRLPASGARP